MAMLVMAAEEVKTAALLGAVRALIASEIIQAEAAIHRANPKKTWRRCLS
jgi:hypothetical protein